MISIANQKKISRLSTQGKIIDLVGVSRVIEMVLFDAGYDTLEKISSAKIEDLNKLSGIGKVTGVKIIESAQEALS